MNRSVRRSAFFGLLLCSVFFCPTIRSAEPAAPSVVCIVPFEGEVEAGLFRFLSRAFEEAKEKNASAVLIEMDTPGGRVDAALEIVDLMLESPVPVSLRVTGTAASAGAIISLAADSVFMDEGTTIGFAAPILVGGGEMPETVEQKTLAYVLAQVRGICERQGWSEQKTRLAEAMVDQDIEIKDPENPDRFITEKGKLLGLTAREAERLRFITAVVKDREGALEQLGLAKAETLFISEHPAERLARFLTGAVVSSLLLSVGFIGLFIEFRAPGFGLPGIVGIVALLLFFWGHTLAGLAGMEGFLLFAVGFVLLALEVFVIPGFGLAGILGLICIVASVVLTLLDKPLGSPHFYGTFEWAGLVYAIILALFSVLLGLLAAMLIPFFIPTLAGTSVGGRIFLADSEKRDEGYSSSPPNTELLGKRGVTRSTLRPVGIAEIEGRRVDVITQGRFVPPETPVEVIQVEGQRIVVRPI